MRANLRPPAIPLDEARDMVMTARLIIDRLDGKRPSEAERRWALDDANDLAFYIAGQSEHLDDVTAKARARAIAGR